MQDYIHWKSLTNPNYTGSWAFKPGERKTLTITKAGKEKVVGENGKTEEKLVVHFKEKELPMICNATNAKMITKLTGTPNIMQWPGQVIVLAVEQVRAKGGGLTDGIRVQEVTADIEAACADCGKPIQANGQFTVSKIVAATQKSFKLDLCQACAGKRKEAAHAAP